MKNESFWRMCHPRSFGATTLWPRLEIGKSSEKPWSRPRTTACPYEIGTSWRLRGGPGAPLARLEPGEDEAREPEQERGDPVLHVVVPRA